ncbi:cytochrome c3 family protein [uncultured Desulfovibrio sp.]|uniref:cytochrome c3 family protein n=1 Tax=uncultured Desulfovibrio sp. TaxID=167968 RepID=UPI00261D887C|nr:cytochrome c3 family protein [uncultured Desulfovibrio sp.]
MRNGTVLLLLAALALAGAACLTAPGTGSAMAATLAPTDSGAPSAIVMFPVSAKPNPKGAAMTPSVFNHLNHEKAVEQCETCHHTGDPVACSTCHTVEGKAEGKFVTLERAMHAVNIRKRSKGNTPTSCVSCHEQQTRERRECAGCHNIVTPRHDAAWCATCHNAASITPQQLQAGIDGTLSAEQNEALAADTVQAQKPNRLLTPMDGPYKVSIGSLADKYLPSNFTHRRHVSSLMERIRGDKLAAAFHNRPEILCATCHHRSPLSATPPKCGSCHTKEIDRKHPDRPNLKAAYHLQCMGCHKGMNVGRPKDTDCTTCHKARP